MQKDSSRKSKVATEIKKILSEFLLKKAIIDIESDVDTSLISITDVIMSACLQHAKVFIISVSNNHNSEKYIEFLEKHKSKLRWHLGSTMKMKYTPDIKFFVDNSFENANRISELFEKIKNVS